MNCDRIASVYRLLEYGAFGWRLERHRTRFLYRLPEQGSVLVLGDGDGRFLAQLALAKPALQIDVLELSRSMIALAQKRLSQRNVVSPERITFQQVDVLETELPEARYSAILAHFFLDCFSDREVQSLLLKIKQSCRSDAVLVLSEFQVPEQGWKRWHARIWLAIMYGFFRLLTGLVTRRLPSYRALLEQQGWIRLQEHSSMADLVCSEIWSRQPGGARQLVDPLPHSK